MGSAAFTLQQPQPSMLLWVWAQAGLMPVYSAECHSTNLHSNSKVLTHHHRPATCNSSSEKLPAFPTETSLLL